MSNINLKKMKFLKFLFGVSFFLLINHVSGQGYAVDKGAVFISGMAGFTNYGGDLFEDDRGNRETSFSLIPSVNFFVAKNVFVGGSLEFTSRAQGDANSNAIGIGPQVGYAFGHSKSTAFPYLSGGIRYYSMSMDDGSYGDSNASGIDMVLGFGVLVPLKESVGLVFEGGYHMMKLKDDYDVSFSGNIFSLGFGIVGLWY